jgi:hypothetical protein
MTEQDIKPRNMWKLATIVTAGVAVVFAGTTIYLGLKGGEVGGDSSEPAAVLQSQLREETARRKESNLQIGVLQNQLTMVEASLDKTSLNDSFVACSLTYASYNNGALPADTKCAKSIITTVSEYWAEFQDKKDELTDSYIPCTFLYGMTVPDDTLCIDDDSKTIAVGVYRERVRKGLLKNCSYTYIEYRNGTANLDLECVDFDGNVTTIGKYWARFD